MMTLTLTATTPPAPGCQSVFAINLDIPGSLAVRRRRRYLVLRLRVALFSSRSSERVRESDANAPLSHDDCMSEASRTLDSVLLVKPAGQKPTTLLVSMNTSIAQRPCLNTVNTVDVDHRQKKNTIKVCFYFLVTS